MVKSLETVILSMKKIIFAIFVFAILAEAGAEGQETHVRVVTHPNEVHIYHSKRLPAGYGFNVYRQDSPGDEFRLLTEEPLTRARGSGELQSLLGEQLGEVMDFFEAESAGELWLYLQSRFLETMIAVSIFPELAESMGMLYIDDEAPVGSEVTYRIGFVNMSGIPYEEPVTKRVLLEPRKPDPPTQLTAANDGRVVTLNWHYPSVEPEDDDKVIRFIIYRIDPETGDPQPVTDEIIIRNNAYDEHSYRFISPVVNVTEQYFVTAADITGQQSAPGEILSYEIVDIELPEVVEDVDVTETTDNMAEISWTIPDDPELKGYNIYRTSDLSAPFIRLTDELLPAERNVYTDTTVAGGITYFYHVTAVNQDGLESERGPLVMVRIMDLIPPPPPENLTAEFDTVSRSIRLNWDIEEITPDLKSFILLRRREDPREPGSFSRVNFDDLTETYFNDPGEGGQGFHEGARYRYVVYSSDDAGNYSDTAMYLIEVPLLTPPDPPGGVLALNDRGLRVNLSWNASPSITVQEYVIYRSEPGSNVLNELARTHSSARFYRDEDVETGNEYIYALTSVDRAGNESEYSRRDTLFFRNTTPPRSVRNVQAVERDGGVFLRWESVPNDDLAGYRVYRSAIPTGVFVPVHEGLLTETEFFDETGEAGKWYRVRAVDSSGNVSRPGMPVRPAVVNQSE